MDEPERKVNEAASPHDPAYGSVRTGGYMPMRMNHENAEFLLKLSAELTARIGKDRSMDMMEAIHDKLGKPEVLGPRNSPLEHIIAAALTLAYELDGILDVLDNWGIDFTDADTDTDYREGYQVDEL